MRYHSFSKATKTSSVIVIVSTIKNDVFGLVPIEIFSDITVFLFVFFTELSVSEKFKFFFRDIALRPRKMTRIVKATKRNLIKMIVLDYIRHQADMTVRTTAADHGLENGGGDHRQDAQDDPGHDLEILNNGTSVLR